jgi:hypothetical protein
LSSKFAHDVESAFNDLAVQFPQLRRVRQIYSVLALAEGLHDAPSLPDLNYILNQHRVRAVPTLESMRVLEAPGAKRLRMSGGVELKALMIRLQDGDATALRDAVLRTRPDAAALTWPLPISRWQIASDAGTDSEKEDDQSPPPGTFGKLGSTINYQIVRPNPGSFDLPVPQQSLNSYSQHLASAAALNVDRLPRSSNIGGVMLSGKAKVAGNSGEVDLSDGGFSLVVEGQNASLSPQEFDRFVTTLWAVYYSKQVPGISIDPIHPKINKHMVRYIGQVVNSDLGRVMREADYQMKKWAVGTDRPDLPDFKTPDDWMAENRDYYEAYRRFWFVPEDFTFRQDGGLLVLAAGHMRLKTELMSGGVRGKTTPADDYFADFVTRNYDRLTVKYPVYTELMEYAKMVALARYMKDQRVPLHWFLMANRDRILTEDSPGTVLELAKKSDHLEGVEIRGGVEMDVQGRYVQDASLRQSLQQASAYADTTPPAADQPATKPAVPVKPATPAPAKPVSYSAVPQKTLTSGRDRRGNRYQTDIAFRMESEPALELVRYFDPRHIDRGMFGNGWNLLLPYRVVPGKGIATTKVRDAELSLPASMLVRNLLSGSDESLVFDDKKYQIMGYVPPAGKSGPTIGLFVTQAGVAGLADQLEVPACRMADKLGNEFSFDQRGLMTQMLLSNEHHFIYTYAREATKTIVRPTVRLAIVPGDMTIAGNLMVPKQLMLTDQAGREGLVLAADPESGRYLPESRGNPHVQFAAVAGDGAHVLVDDEGNKVFFTPNGSVESIDFSPLTHVVQSMKYERLEPEVTRDGDKEVRSIARKPGQEVSFEYLMDLTGMLRVGRARITSHSPETDSVLRYDYDSNGYLIGISREKPKQDGE